MSIDKNKINEALEEITSKVNKNETKMENKLKRKLMEAEENQEAEIIDSLVGDENLEEPEALNSLESSEETPEEEQAEYVDVTGGVEEQDGVFTVKSTAEVELAPGNRIKFMVGDEEFRGTIGDIVDDEEGLLSITLSDEVPTPAGENEPDDLDDLDDLNGGEGSEEIEDSDVIEESIIEEVLQENYLDNRNYKGYNYNYDGGPLAEDVIEEEDLPVDNAPVSEDPVGANPLAGDPGVEEEIPSDVSMDVTSGGGAGAPAAAPEVNATGASAVTPGADVSQIVSTDQLIQDLLGSEEENPLDIALASQITEEIIEEVIQECTENPNYEKATNTAKNATKLNTVEITGKVKATGKDAAKGPGEKFTPSKVAKQGDVNSTDLKAGGGKVNPEAINSPVSQAARMKANLGKISSTVKDNKDSSINVNDDFTSKVKQDNAVKSKALVKLSEDFIKVETENKKLRFENYKLLKLNGLLTLLPELEQTTREQLVEKFDKCSSDTQVISLYKKISTAVKESRKPNLNQLVTNNKKDVKYFTEGRAHDEQLLKEKVDATQNGNQDITPEQLRKNNLMGIRGAEEAYYNF